MAQTNARPAPGPDGTEPPAPAMPTADVVAHAVAGAILELQRLSPERQAETALGAQSSGSCGVTSCLFDPV